MGETITNMLPYAIGIAISPVPIITVILMLFSPSPRGNAAGFLLGWFLGIGIPALVILQVDRVINPDNVRSEPSQMASMIRIGVGSLLMILAARKWMRRNRPDGDDKPMLMKVVDAVTPWKAVLLGFLFADVTNPKNFALTVAGCMAIIAGHLPPVQEYIAIIVFTLLSSFGVALPVILFLSGGDAAKITVEQWRQWLVRHKKAVMAVLFFVFGLALLFRGLSA